MQTLFGLDLTISIFNVHNSTSVYHFYVCKVCTLMMYGARLVCKKKGDEDQFLLIFKMKKIRVHLYSVIDIFGNALLWLVYSTLITLGNF